MKNTSKDANVKSGHCEKWQVPHFEPGENNFKKTSVRSPASIIREQRKSGQDQEYKSGFDQGYSEGVKQGQQLIQEQVEHLQSLMATLAMPLLDLDEQVIDELVELSMAVVKQLVRRELKTSPDEIVAVVKEALSLLPVVTGEVQLELHTEDAAIVRNVMGVPESESSWKIVENPVLTRGGCRVFTNSSRIDATVETRINAAIASVLGNRHQVDQE